MAPPFRSAADYLNDWAHPEKGWLRKFYRQGSDEAQFDLMPATEKAIAWLETLSRRQLCRHRIAAVDPVRIAAPDRHRQ